MSDVIYAKTKSPRHYKNYAHELLTQIPYEYNDNFCIFSAEVAEEATFYIAADRQALISDLSLQSEGNLEIITQEDIPLLHWKCYGNKGLMPR